jgi:ribosomal-protein-alanine N-acetyltransferase
MPVAVRPATSSEVAAILAIERQSPSAAHWTSEQYNNLLRNGVVLVSEEAGKLAGFICAKAVAGEWEIENVVVAPEFLRRGIASRLLSRLIQQARNAEASAILLEVRESNEAARWLYEKHDFREVGSRPAYYDDPVENAILYTLRFDV